MKAAKTVLLLIAAIMMAVLFAPNAKADVANQMTEVTFSHSIQIPGHKVLAPGTYWFTMADNGNDGRIMVIYNRDRNHVEALLQTAPTYRSVTGNKTELTLAEQGRNRPDVLVNWFYPGLNYGQGFIYTQRMQNRLAEEPVVKVFANNRNWAS